VKPVFDIDIRHAFPSGFDLDFQLQSHNGTIGLIGPSGSGKTSVLHAVAGIFRPQHASIQFKGQCFSGSNTWMPPRHRRVGLVTQDALLYPHLSVAENLGFGIHSKAAITPKDPIIEMLEIGHLLDRRIRYLSGGERQRVALGRALLSEPSMLLADEPFSAIDIERRSRIVEKLKAHIQQTSCCMLLVSHDAAMANALCSTTIQMKQGSIHPNE